MSALKRLLIGFLLFELTAGVSLGLDRENMVFREALGLYTTGQSGFALAIMEKLASRQALKRPETKALMGFLYECSGKYTLAESYLNSAWSKGSGNVALTAAVEDAAVRAFALNNPIGASVVLDLALKKASSRRERCYLLFNSLLTKRLAGLPGDREKQSLLKECGKMWFYPMLEGSLLLTPSSTHRSYPIPTPSQSSP